MIHNSQPPPETVLICINGVSLTVARIHNNTCMLAIIPHTLA
ncbi:MAG: riboflavin synthase, partial [Bacteroidota bacterium]